MANELELKAVVTDAEALRQALDDAGAVLRFHGMMRDRRLDREGQLSGRDQVFRVRLWSDEEGGPTVAEIGWKGPTSVDPDGYKQREELQFNVDDGETALQVMRTLGYSIVESIDRYVEIFELEGTVARIEWFPRMDVLVEIEGSPDGIENLIAVTGLDRDSCLPDPLAAFSQRFTERTGETALLAEDQLDGAPPTWMAR